jgi:hypothetical protein
MCAEPSESEDRGRTFCGVGLLSGCGPGGRNCRDLVVELGCQGSAGI